MEEYCALLPFLPALQKTNENIPAYQHQCMLLLKYIHSVFNLLLYENHLYSTKNRKGGKKVKQWFSGLENISYF